MIVAGSDRQLGVVESLEKEVRIVALAVARERGLGVTRQQVTGLILLEAGVLGIFGSIAGVGLGMALVAWNPTGWILAAILTLDAIMLVGLVVFSYLVWRDDPNRISPAGVMPAPDAVERTDVPRG